MTPLVRFKHVDFSYHGGAKVLDDITFDIPDGCVFTLLGPNGAGKSTLLNCINGYCVPQAGTIEIESQDIRTIGRREIARKVALVSQERDSAFEFAVRDYVAMGRTPYHGMFEGPSEEDYAIVAEALSDMGIERLASKPFSGLSGGERQMVDLCRAIAQKPRIVLLDEPTSALDFGNQRKTLVLIKRLHAQGHTVVLTTHNPDHPLLLGGHVGLLDRSGRLTVGTVDEAIDEERLTDLYQTKVRIVSSGRDGRRMCVMESLEEG